MRPKLNNSENRIAGIPKKFWGIYLDEITPLNEEQGQYKEKLEQVLAGKWWSLTVLGTVGNGKTLGACGAVALWNSRRPWTAFYVTQEELVEECKGTFSDDSRKSEREVLSKYMEAGLLVLDELTVRGWTDYTKNIVQRILSYRHGQELRTVVIGNLEVDTLKGMLDEHILSRLREGETQIMKAEDMRLHGEF